MLYTDDDKTQRFYNRVAQLKTEYSNPAPSFLRNKPAVQLELPGKSSAKPLHIHAGLEPYEGNLTRQQAAQLIRRTGFGASAEQINATNGARCRRSSR